MTRRQRQVHALVVPLLFTAVVVALVLLRFGANK